MTVTSSHPCTFRPHLGLPLYPPGLAGLSCSSHSCGGPREGGYSPDPAGSAVWRLRMWALEPQAPQV